MNGKRCITLLAIMNRDNKHNVRETWNKTQRPLGYNTTKGKKHMSKAKWTLDSSKFI
jgi:hypothetical protein